LYCIAMFRLYEVLGYTSLKNLLESDLITSKCPQECYKQINRAKFELMIHEGDFNKVGLLPSSHLDMFSLIPVDSKTSCELTARVKSVYHELYIERNVEGTVTASDVKEYILDRFQKRNVSRAVSSTLENDESNISEDAALDWDDDDLDNVSDEIRNKGISGSDSVNSQNYSLSHSFENLVINQETLPALSKHLSRSLDNDGKIRLAYFLNKNLLDTGDASLHLLLKNEKIPMSALTISLKRMKYYMTKVFI